MERLYASYNEDIEFLIVYIREAHPNMLKEGNTTGIVGRPKTFDERIILATECVTKYQFTIPMVIDGLDGKVNSDYKAAPVRVTVVDVDGKVVFYAGKGPWDFRLPPVERTLRKLITHQGHIPPPPKPQWGRSVNGMRCGLSIDPESFVLSEPVAAHLRFENTTREPINFYYQAEDVLKHIAIDNGNGQSLKMEAAGGNRWSRRRKKESPIKKIGAGETFETSIEGKIIDASGQTVFAAGPFQAMYTLQVNDDMLAQIELEPKETVWTGKLASGTYAMRVAAPLPTRCIDCHGVGDYHHKDNQSCETCHVGQVGNDDFDIRKDACGRCHPREGLYGRRQILGPGGEFDMASKHISGSIEDKDCLLCHDTNRHRSGVVGLIDPDSGGKKPWTGSRIGFCLICHDGAPPAHVTFPEESSGSGLDKSKFLDSAMTRKQQSCCDCHTPHGSPYPSLLKDLHGH